MIQWCIFTGVVAFLVTLVFGKICGALIVTAFLLYPIETYGKTKDGIILCIVVSIILLVFAPEEWQPIVRSILKW